VDSPITAFAIFPRFLRFSSAKIILHKAGKAATSSAVQFCVLHSGANSSAYNMALDEALLEAMPRLETPVLRFYDWTEPAASFGYFQKYSHVEGMTALRPLVRRPTAGGLVPHDADWTYSLVFPTIHEWYSLTAIQSYERVHQWIQSAFEKLGVVTLLAPERLKAEAGQCFVGYEKSDLLWRGQKIAGAAQRRTRDGLLIQGSVQPPPISVQRSDWEHAMQETAIFANGVEWTALATDPLLENRVHQLVVQKYSLASYNQKR
jgi:lipoate-protein ligase A